MKLKKRKEAYLILYNIRSAENVGAIFRTGEAVGVSKIYLIGYTPCPIDRFNRSRPDIAKAALGAEELVPWQHFKTIGLLLSKIKNENIEIVALEQSKRAVDYKKFKPKNSFALILGNEVTGIPESILKKVDVVAQISMQGQKESLNVSVAAGVALYQFLNI